MKNMINPTVLMAIATFLWYRKGRLWFFYDTLVSKCTVQITKDSIDREKWEEIALQQCEQLAHETFQSLFRFEVEYLQEHIANHKYEFWIGDSEANTDYSIKYTDKTTFCKFRIRELFHSLFEFCGLRLFVKALFWRLIAERSRDTGYVKTLLGPTLSGE